MRSLSAFLLALSPLFLTAALAFGDQDAPAPLPEEAVARIDSTLITRAEYADYLIALSGNLPLQDLIYLRLLETEAALRGLPAVDAQLNAEWQAEEARLLARNESDPQRMRQDLDQMGFGYDGYKRRFLVDKRPKLLEQSIIMATRTVSPEAIATKFNLDYGMAGIKVEVRHLMLTRARMQKHLRTQGVQQKDISLELLDKHLAAKAAELFAELQTGANFEVVARRESADLSVHQNGGVIPNYNYKHYGEDFAKVVRAAEVGEVNAPLNTPGAVHITKVEKRTVTKLTDVSAAITAQLSASAAQHPERVSLRARLFSEHSVQTRDSK